MSAHPFATAARLPRLAALCAATLVCAGLHTAVMAQSRFTVSTLKPPSLGKLEANQIIDNQNRVFSFLKYYDGIGLEFGFGGSQTRLVTKYQAYPATWPATTSASLSPTKLINTKSLRVTSLSRNGGKMLVNQTITQAQRTFFAPAIFDTATRQPLSYVINGSAATNLGEGAEASSVNELGWVAGAMRPVPFVIGNDQILAARWRPGQAVEMLPMGPGMTQSAATSINSAGEVAGWVGTPNADGLIVRRPAKWGVDGALQLVNPSSQGGYQLVSIADNGTVLMVGYKLRIDGTDYTTLTLVAANGAAQNLPIASSQDADPLIGHHSLSPDGDTVVGITYAVGVFPRQPSARAFLFKDGVMHDLTTYATARGLKLPTGARLMAATSVNAQGSITAGYDTADGKFVALKLTAVP
jgi:hypothetical protein